VVTADGTQQRCLIMCTSSHQFLHHSQAHMQEFNLEKLNLLESEKQRIRKEYERKGAQVESHKKMCVVKPSVADPGLFVCLHVPHVHLALSPTTSGPKLCAQPRLPIKVHHAVHR
jgi:hypothetical protein